MRLIDADALVERSGEPCHSFLDVIESMPTIDAVPVVRCKDCTWFFHGFCVRFDPDVMPDDFCSRGHVET